MCGPVLPLCLLLWILRATQGVAAVVQTQQTVSAALGKDATLSCQLLETKVVSQVTWQKVSGNTEKNICTYSEKFGSSVYPEYKDKIQFTEAGSQKSSIVIRNVTEQDAGCYRCLFTTFPDGNLIGRTCLKVHFQFQCHLYILHRITEASDGFLLLQQWQPGIFYCPAWNRNKKKPSKDATKNGCYTGHQGGPDQSS
ncbi:OX-2 membrane glycoprotein-like isoform X1 [Poecilia latipinna]|uniref:OX-2 membrane glycoprotein-like isoform X1 n=1 Tax=Poecilia latipinna TaxID=48699 RepID=UPI00072E51EF|nr:PREDICTED: OX-2 membrane glycoprotein-like isoform X1 [Poecilia latipinna]